MSFVKEVIKGRTTQGVRSALRQLRSELRVQRLHRAGIKAARRYDGAAELKLNLGCGPNSQPGWVNVDLVETADLCLDLREPLPFEDGSAALVYTEHLFEHLEFPDEAEALLREVMRVLRPGGVISIGVPDAEAPLMYQAAEMRASESERAAGGEARLRLSAEPHNLWVPRYVFTTPLHMVNWPFRHGKEHKYAYDFETLRDVLAGVGFVRIERRPLDPALDSEARREGTLYVEGRKPDQRRGLTVVPA